MTASLTAIVLAAGRSQRMGRPKPLLPFGDRTVLQQVLAALAAARPERTLLVLGPKGEPIAASVADRPLTLVWNRASESEMVDSLRATLPHLPADGQGVMICLGDQPLIAAATYSRLADCHRRNPDCILQPRTGGRTGHPVLLPQDLFAEIADRSTLRDLLAAYPERVQSVEVEDPGILLDMDTPGDYRRLQQLRGEVQQD